MVDRVRAHVKQDRENRRIRLKTALYSEARGISDETPVQISADVVQSALSSITTNTRESLTVLKKAFVEDSAYINTFMRHKSALHFVAGRLMSREPYEQLEALECCCNASLGDAKSCGILASACAIYVIQFLHGTNLNLINVALPTLGNMCMSSVTTCKLLQEQGLQPGLLAALQNVEYRQQAAKSLSQYTFTYLPYISDEQVLEILKVSLPLVKSCPQVLWLVAQLSPCEAARLPVIESDVARFCLDHLNAISSVTGDNFLTVTASIRLLGNLRDSLPCDMNLNDGLENILSCGQYPFVIEEFKWLKYS